MQNTITWCCHFVGGDRFALSAAPHNSIFSRAVSLGHLQRAFEKTMHKPRSQILTRIIYKSLVSKREVCGFLSK